MKRIYLDNGATAFPKAPGLGQIVADFIENNGVNVGRGAYKEAFEAQRVVMDCRELLKELADAPKGHEVVFTQNITQSLNTVIKGLFNKGDHVIISSMEHNAIMRPMNSVADGGVLYSRVACTNRGELVVSDLKNHLRPTTKAIIMTHASNVCGTIMDLAAVSHFAKEHKLMLVVDAAQTFGAVPFSMKDLDIDILCFTGHKALLGPQGMGGMILSQQTANFIRPFIEGGTGSVSDEEVQPGFLPDKFESGTPNLPGIYGLHHALRYLKDLGIENVQKHEAVLVDRFLEGLKAFAGIRPVGLPTSQGRTAVISVDFSPMDNAEIAYRLEKEYHIQTRVGMHCAPAAHRTLGTHPQGTVRFSFSHFTTAEEVDFALEAIGKIMASY